MTRSEAESVLEADESVERWRHEYDGKLTVWTTGELEYATERKLKQNGFKFETKEENKYIFIGRKSKKPSSYDW